MKASTNDASKEIYNQLNNIEEISPTERRRKRRRQPLLNNGNRHRDRVPKSRTRQLFNLMYWA